MSEPGRSAGSTPPGLVAAVGVLLAIPVVALLWVSSYNKVKPRLGGVPFFYWYQFLWVFLAAACTTRRLPAGRRAPAPPARRCPTRRAAVATEAPRRRPR